MILPGMRYQDHAWGDVKQLLRRAMLAALSRIGVPAILSENGLDTHCGELRLTLLQYIWADEARLTRIDTRNWQGDGVLELASDLADELFTASDPKNVPGGYLLRLRDKIAKLTVYSGDWSAPLVQRKLGKTIADIWVELRDAVDARNFMLCTHDAMSANRIDCLRKVETHARTVCHILENWQAHPELVGYILGRELTAEPIEAVRVRQGAPCRAEWLLRWSEAFPRFYPVDEKGQPAVGPFHTQSKKFTCSLENIAQCLRDLDPCTGTFAGQINPGEADFLVSLRRIGEHVVEDDAHESRVLPAPDADCFIGILDQDTCAHSDEVSQAADYGQDDDESADDYVQKDSNQLLSDFFAPPPQDMYEEDESDSRQYSAGLNAFPWPVQLALLLRLAGGRFDHLLRNLLESWDKDTDLRKWSIKRLAGELSKIESAVITEYKFNQRVDAAYEELIKAAVQVRLTACHGERQ